MSKSKKKIDVKSEAAVPAEFANLRSTAARKKWDHTFVRTRGGDFAALYVEAPNGEWLEEAGAIATASKAMRARVIASGLMQSRPGAPAGNSNACAENRKPSNPKNDLRKGPRA